MFTLRCTQKLLQRMGTSGPDSALASTTVLGDWYANILFTRPRQLVLCISERTLLPVVVAAKDVQRLPSRLIESLPEVLCQLGVDGAAIAQEQAEMREIQINRSASKQVLGSLNQLMFQLESQIHWHPDLTLIEHALRLAETPMKGIEYSSPAQATSAMFHAASTLRAAREWRHG
ncbi:hypothetical protein [Hydrogenophaga sp.]|uniref:DUF6933 domain-containing protein n=1 Tax=Hydrogenophaga sp. TaxID=1904254 RepID=UPI00273151D7|nr:hypothetical protein [Hydrogenophaga sp.]MDP2018887.1 hypothetical protein [Hydrogenophaga sp.]MDP3167728.1 hypothetical protein [Hydrogenophaga sp.]MDP3813020.1 hypothetical protein [Hydrogenophaga sp.]